ncbi:dihydrolipoyl dehydrogenase family protein [Mastigocoleus testarum]|uniref:Mercuric reductase n=1 Tax=Mastigocoleus testarum BC008 TaxID=371196 RepID=A0A0V7ZS40_9CYAN|nr:NAD(P)/FAD-dependent oxidoreductase [Mastigocoleus testarum]KST67320.1 mercuric reductase [Mastigocoleus testarum BC008]
MTIDYDVVIIGGTLAGRYAAWSATQFKARVALVEPNVSQEPIKNSIKNYTFTQTSKFLQKLSNLPGFGIDALCSETKELSETKEQCQILWDWDLATLYADGIFTNTHQQLSLTMLAAQGVDVVTDKGQFQISPNLSFVVKDRSLRSRSYLLATGANPAIPDIEGLGTVGYVTSLNIWDLFIKSQSTPPRNWTILGGLPQSIEIAQILVRLNCQVTLILEHPYIFSQLDPEIALLILAELEAEGVRILQETVVTQVRQIDGKKWLQAGDKAIETDEIVVATAQQPNIESLNLAAVGVKWYQNRLLVNKKLQTTNHKIYACGDVMGGYSFGNIANYEARIALKNALFFPISKVNYRSIPWGISSQPAIAQVGLTEPQAKRRHSPKEIIVLKQYFKTLTKAQVQDEITGICKLIIRPNGEILGASILGKSAGEIINIIALAIAKKIRIKELSSLSAIYPSYSEILVQTAQMWEREKLNRNTGLKDFLENFFHFRRSWKI